MRDWCHNLFFRSTSWCNSHHKNVMRLTSLKRNCHTCCFANGFTVNIPSRNFLLRLRNCYFLRICNSRSVGLIKIRLISNVFANLRWLPHEIPMRRKLNKIHYAAHICNCELNFQKTSISCSYPTVFCSNYWNMTCQIKNNYDRNRKKLQR